MIRLEYIMLLNLPIILSSNSFFYFTFFVLIYSPPRSAIKLLTIVTGSAKRGLISDPNSTYLETHNLTCECVTILKLGPNMWPYLGKPFQIAHQAPPAYVKPHHPTISFQPKLWYTYLRLIVAGVNSWWCERLKWVASGTGKCLGWLYPVSLLFWAAQTSTLLNVLHFRH